MTLSSLAPERRDVLGASFPPVRTVEVNGARLAVRERGDGEPVVFVHGAVSDLRTWSPQFDAIGERYRTVAYSCRYARPNEDIAPEGEHDMRVHVADLAALLRVIDASPAHLVGNSSGAIVCLLTAVRHPEAVRTLTLEEPPVMTMFVSPEPRPHELLRLLGRRPRTCAAIVKMGATSLGPAARAFRRGDDERGLRHFMRGILGHRHLERLPDVRLEQARANAAALRATLLRTGLPEISADDVRGVSAPTLLLLGADSGAFPRRLTEALEELLPDSTRVEVPGGSHFAHEDNPDAVNAAILAFLDARAEPHAVGR